MEVKVSQNVLFSEFVGFLSRNSNALPLYQETISAISIYTPLCHTKAETGNSFLLTDNRSHGSLTLLHL